MSLIPSVAAANSACPWHWPMEVSSCWPRVYRAPEILELGLELPRKLRGKEEGGSWGFKSRTRPKGETVPGPFGGRQAAEVVVNSGIS